MDRIGRIGNDDDVARRGDRLRDVGEAFLGAERGDDLRVGIELHPEPPRVISGLRAAQPRNALRRRIAVGARFADRILDLFDHVRGRRQIRIAHAQIDDIGATVARGRLGAIDLLEHVRREAADAIKFFHGVPGRVGLKRPPPLLSRPRVGGRGLRRVAAAGACAETGCTVAGGFCCDGGLPVACRWRCCASVLRWSRWLIRLSVACLTSSGVSVVSARGAGISCTDG